MWLQAGAGTKPRSSDAISTSARRILSPSASDSVSSALGRADVGQRGDEDLDVLIDPEGNEFCLLHRPAPRLPGETEQQRGFPVARAG